MSVWSWIKSKFSKQETKVEQPSNVSKKLAFGIDVSHHNGELNWTPIKESGVDFAFIKATEGSSYKDPKFYRNVGGAKKEGILVGAYHYFVPGASIQLQINNFLNTIDGIKLDLPAVFDWEAENGTNPTDQIKDALMWLKEVEKKTGKKPIIYTGPSFFKDIIGSPNDFKDYPLWIAHYGVKSPIVPKPWSKWNFWQFSETFRLSKISGQFDANYFEGTVEKLKGLT